MTVEIKNLGSTISLYCSTITTRLRDYTCKSMPLINTESKCIVFTDDLHSTIIAFNK